MASVVRLPVGLREQRVTLIQKRLPWNPGIVGESPLMRREAEQIGGFARLEGVHDAGDHRAGDGTAISRPLVAPIVWLAIAIGFDVEHVTIESLPDQSDDPVHFVWGK